MEQPHRNQLRQFISKYFNINELKTLCFEYFPAVTEELGDSPRKSALVPELIEYSERHGKYVSLVMAIENARPELFKKQFGKTTQKDRKPAKPPGTVKRNPKQIFLSHSTKDGQFANELAGELRAKGWQVWIAPESIEDGEKWEPAIERGLKSSSIFILLISPNAAGSEFVKDETVIAREMSRRGELELVFLNYKETEAPLFWSTIQWTTFEAINARSLDRLFDALESKPQLDSKLAQPDETVAKTRREKAKVEAKDFALVYIAAVKAEELGDLEEAYRLFRQVAKGVNSGVWGENAKTEIKKIDQIWAERAFSEKRQVEYERVKTLLAQNKRVGKIAWEEFKQNFPDFDPDKIADMFGPPKPKFELAQPFVWIGIPRKGYSLSKYPITNGQFAQFVQDGGYETDQWWTVEGLTYRKNKKWTEPRLWQDEKWNGSTQPVVGVSWFEAVAFCNWLGNKLGQRVILPTEEQWQYAAQGDDGRKYPWGNEWDGTKCNSRVGKNGIGKTTPVTQFEKVGASPFGVVDMAGNVWEWCLTDYNKNTNDAASEAKYRVLRGGSWYFINVDFFAVSNRNWNSPNFRLNDFGFRAALSL